MDITHRLQVSRSNLGCRKILSNGAQRLIHEGVISGVYQNRKDKCEPPFMAPSIDPEDYSRVCATPSPSTVWLMFKKWCSLCNDFGSLLVLCAGCRVAICVRMYETLTGCIVWDSEIEDNDFVYHCPYCAWGKMGTISPVSPLNRSVFLHLISATLASPHKPGGPTRQGAGVVQIQPTHHHSLSNMARDACKVWQLPSSEDAARLLQHR